MEGRRLLTCHDADTVNIFALNRNIVCTVRTIGRHGSENKILCASARRGETARYAVSIYVFYQALSDDKSQDARSAVACRLSTMFHRTTDSIIEQEVDSRLLCVVCLCRCKSLRAVSGSVGACACRAGIQRTSDSSRRFGVVANVLING